MNEEKVIKTKAILEENRHKIVSSRENWKNFLETSSYLYKYPNIDDHVLVYSQRPKAVACANFSIWNNFNRSVKKGVNGIALLRNSKNNKTYIEYVFDIADTVQLKEKEVKEVPLWELKSEYMNVVFDDLSSSLKAKGNLSKTDNFNHLVSSMLITSFSSKETSNNEKANLSEQEREFIVLSALYITLKRCGLDTSSVELENIEIFKNDYSFEKIFSITAEISRDVLGEIENSVKKAEKEFIKSENSVDKIDEIIDTSSKNSNESIDKEKLLVSDKIGDILHIDNINENIQEVLTENQDENKEEYDYGERSEQHGQNEQHRGAITREESGREDRDNLQASGRSLSSGTGLRTGRVSGHSGET